MEGTEWNAQHLGNGETRRDFVEEGEGGGERERLHSRCHHQEHLVGGARTMGKSTPAITPLTNEFSTRHVFSCQMSRIPRA